LKEKDVYVQLKDYFGQALSLSKLQILNGVSFDVFDIAEKLGTIPNISNNIL
jgi:hypothetical protein